MRHEESPPSQAGFLDPERGVISHSRFQDSLCCIPKILSLSRLSHKMLQIRNFVDHLLGVPFVSLDGIWNDAKMKGVIGWSSQL